MVDVNKVIKDIEELTGKTFTDEQRKTIEAFGEFMDSLFPDTESIIQEPESKTLEINEVVSGLDYCLNTRRCIGCEHSKGRMFATCKPLAENALRILKNIEEKAQTKAEEPIKIPSKFQDIAGSWKWGCPKCKYAIGYCWRFCPSCGQEIDWKNYLPVSE